MILCTCYQKKKKKIMDEFFWTSHRQFFYIVSLHLSYHDNTPSFLCWNILLFLLIQYIYKALTNHFKSLSWCLLCVFTAHQLRWFLMLNGSFTYGTLSLGNFWISFSDMFCKGNIWYISETCPQNTLWLREASIFKNAAWIFNWYINKVHRKVMKDNSLPTQQLTIK